MVFLGGPGQPLCVLKIDRWQKRRFRAYWRSISAPGPGRPPISEEIKALPMATGNRWRAWKIQAELSKLGIRVGLSTISRYLSKAEPNPTCQQRWTTFLRNHRDLTDAIIFATASRHGAEIVTSDVDFDGLPGVTLIR
jgi:predicted nucleic acid-binding protein